MKSVAEWLCIAAALLIVGVVIHLAQTIQDQRITIHGLIHTHEMEHRAIITPLPQSWREGEI